ncbi:MAG: ParA family protein [Eggerthellaceae bacterium]|nr:ParA family protein [Eggerthellaceae bacterium]
MNLPELLSPVTVICGHYGVGKTNFALNLALDASKAGFKVTLIDLDIVNPYFRSSEYRVLLDDSGVSLVSPVFAQAGTSLDVPSLTGAIIPAINRAYFDHAKGSSLERVIIDVGGDDAGATALARYTREISAGPHDLLYVVNKFRNLTQNPEDAVEVLQEIQERSGLRATGLVSNAHLKSETSLSEVFEGARFAYVISDMTSIEAKCITLPISLVQQVGEDGEAIVPVDKRYPVRILVKSPWE